MSAATLNKDGRYVQNIRFNPATLTMAHSSKYKQILIKAVLLGDLGVGKTTLFKRIRECGGLKNHISGSWDSQSIDMCTKSFITSEKQKVQVTSQPVLINCLINYMHGSSTL